MRKLRKRNSYPQPGKLYYQCNGNQGTMINIWFLTVDERHPEEGSYDNRENYEFAKWVLGGNPRTEHRLDLWIYDGEGRRAKIGTLTPEAREKIGIAINGGEYSGKLRKKDFGYIEAKFTLMNRRPRVKFSGENGNIFNLLAIATKALKKEGQADKAKEMQDRVYTQARDYDHAIRIIMEYVEVD